MHLNDEELSIAELSQTSVLANMFWGILLCSRLPRAGGDDFVEKSPADPWLALPLFRLNNIRGLTLFAGKLKSVFQAWLIPE